METKDLLEGVIRIAGEETWESWSKAQQGYILKHHKNQLTGIIEELNGIHGKNWSRTRNYPEKHWELEKKACKKCKFPFTFSAMPTNWSMKASADVWNLTKCANVDCAHLSERCI